MRRHRPERAPRAIDRKASRAWAAAVHRLGLMTYKFPPFDSWEELQNAREEAGFSREPEPIDGSLPAGVSIAASCLSVFHSFLSTSAMLVFTNIPSIKRNRRPKFQASFSLLSGMATDVAAIELLIRNGFDIQAKVIVRSLREKLDALLAVQLDRSFAVGFVTADGPEQANEFWHRKVARGKLIKNVAKRLSHYSSDGESPIDHIWLRDRREFDRWLGEAVHPSHTTGVLAAFPTFGSGEPLGDGIGLFGHPSEFSLPTARSVLGLSYEVIFLLRARQLAVPQALSVNGSDKGELLTLPYAFEVSEKFLIRCVANSMLGPNLDMFKLQMYLDGFILQPLEGDFHRKAYETEILDAMLKVLRAAKAQIEARVTQAEERAISN